MIILANAQFVHTQLSVVAVPLGYTRLTRAYAGGMFLVLWLLARTHDVFYQRQSFSKQTR